MLRPHLALAAGLAAGALAAVAPGPVAAQAPAGPRGSFDPSASARVVATANVDAQGLASVVVRAPRRPPAVFPGARSPAVDGDLLAYADDAGLRVVRWTTGEEIARLAEPLEKPALDWPLVAYVRQTAGGERLELRNLVTGSRRLVARVGRAADLGRPALRQGLVAWHVAAGRRSVLRVRPVGAGRRSKVIATSVTGLQVNPSIAAGRILWVEHTGSVTLLHLRRIAGGPVRTLASLRGPSRILWTTALGSSRAYATRWNPARGRAEIISRAWRR